MGRVQIGQEPRQATPNFAGAPEGDRTITIYRVAMLTIATGPILCLVRALSSRTATLDIDMPFTAQDNAIVEIGRERFAGALVKTGDRRAELRSRETIDVHAVLADPSFLASAGRRALPRVAVDSRARIDIGGQRFAARVRDISTDGIKIFTEELLSVGDEVRIVLKGLERPLPAIVRWCDGDHAGVEFVQRLPISRLNAWLAQQSASAADEGGTPWPPPVISKS